MGLRAVRGVALKTLPGLLHHLPDEGEAGLAPLPLQGQALPVVVEPGEGQQPADLQAVAGELVVLHVHVGGGVVQLVVVRHGETGEGKDGLREELVLPEDEASHGLAVRVDRLEAEEGFAGEAVEGVALDVAQTELDVEGRVVEMTEPVVGDGELLTPHLDGVSGQALEVSHAENVELPALAYLYPEHGDPLELAGEHRELSHVA